MAHTTKPVADSRGLIERLEQEIVKRGVPDGYQYKTLDRDVESEPDSTIEPGTITIKKREVLYLATVNILVRATSPDCAASAITLILNTLEDWDYAVQDGERQLPKCISLDLEPENITELLDHIAT